MIRYGVSKLSDGELLALILKSGNKNESVIDLANNIISSYKTIKNLAITSYNELCKINGIKKAKATSLLAAIELGKRVFIIQNNNIKVNNNYDIYKVIYPEVKNLLYEEFYVISLNSKSYIISVDKIASGNSNSVSLNISSIFHIAIKNMASAIIICHNHPSGDCTPSYDDRITTKKVIDASRTVQINLIDHIIIGNNEIYSFLKDSKEFFNI